MVYNRVQRLLTSSNGGGTVHSIACGTRGGIVLSIQMITVANALWNQGNANESIRQGDLQIAVADPLTSTSIIGQDSTGFIRLPVNYTWRWDNPHKYEFNSASSYIGKLGVYDAMNPQPPGLFKGLAIAVVVATDPVQQVPHKLSFEAEILAFDSFGF